MTKKYSISVAKELIVHGPLALPPVCIKTGEPITTGENPIVDNISNHYLFFWQVIIYLFALRINIFLGLVLIAIKFLRMRMRYHASVSYYLSQQAIVNMNVYNSTAFLLVVVSFCYSSYVNDNLHLVISAVILAFVIHHNWGSIHLTLSQKPGKLVYIKGIPQKSIESILLWEKEQKKNYPVSLKKPLEDVQEKVKSEVREDFESLNLKEKNLNHIPEKTLENTKLIHLDVSNNKITTVSPKIRNLQELASLKIANNPLKTFPVDILELPKLLDLDIGNTRLSAFPENIVTPTSIYILNLTSNRIKKIPQSIEMFTSLTSLDVSNNQLIGISEKLFELPLETLHLQNNRLGDISPQIKQLTQLKELNLAYNKLQILPPEIAALKSLKYLNLKGNQFSVFPEEILNLNQLETLDLSENKLTTLPSLKKLVNLRVLILGHNQIKELSAKEISFIEYLSLQNNELCSFSCFSPTLKEINISHNKITEIPAQIADCIHLEDLYMSHNNLTILPKEIGFLSRLKFLDVAENKLKNIPNEICNLKYLEKLDLHKNELLNIPQEWNLLPKIQQVNVIGNPRIELSRQIISQLGTKLIYDKTFVPIIKKTEKDTDNHFAFVDNFFVHFTVDEIAPINKFPEIEKWNNTICTYFKGKIFPVMHGKFEKNLGKLQDDTFIFFDIKDTWQIREKEKIGEYYILKKIWEDPYYNIFIVCDLTKIYKLIVFKEILSSNEVFTFELGQDAKKIADLQHPCLPEVRVLEKENNQIYFVHEKTAGIALDEWMKNNREMPEETCVFYLLQIISAFKLYFPDYKSIGVKNIFIHNHTIYFAHILLGAVSKINKYNEPLIVKDFLIDYFLAAPENLKSKLEHSTPENILVFNLGILLYFMRTGSHPFITINDKNLLNIMQKVVNSVIKPLPQHVKNENIYQIIKKMLQKNPENRYQHLSEIEADIKSNYAQNFVEKYFYDTLFYESEQHKTYIAFNYQNPKIVWISTFHKAVNFSDKLLKMLPKSTTKLTETIVHKSNIYFIFDYEEGNLLSIYIKQKKLSYRKLCHFCLEIINLCEQLSAKNLYPLLNKDIIFINVDNRVKFFLPKLLEQFIHPDKENVLSIDDGLNIAHEEEIHFRSPEDILELHYDISMQIYSLGILMYYSISQQYPYKKESLLSFKFIRPEYIYIQERIPTIPSHIADIINKATAYTKEQRYQNWQDFKENILISYHKLLEDAE